MSHCALILVGLFVLGSGASALPTEPYSPEHLTPPPPTYPNGTDNPFYPCGYSASQVSACPYRCYDATNGTRTLDPKCYTASSATSAIQSLQSICVQCQVPNQVEDQPGGSCEPLRNYLTGARPARCGSADDRLPDCAWDCNTVQTPFSICDSRDSSGTFRICNKCKPQCSSPRIVFQPGYPPANFSIASGDCGSGYGAVPQRQRVTCPYRCKDVANPYRYCAFEDKTARFTECERCA